MNLQESQVAMPKSPPRRKYDSARRQAQARQTRLRIAKAARKLFIARGYAGATIEAIAAQAQVAKETVYASFKTKPRLLAFLLDISIGGDDQNIRMVDRPERQAVLHDTDQRRQIGRFARDMAEIMARAAPVFEVMRVAAKTEPEIARRLKRLYQERLENLTTVVRYFAAHGPLRDGLTEAQAAEIVWAATSPELFQLLAEYRDWSKERYSQWLEDALIRLLLP
jgi:AcrR family transcriptional regulator